MGRDNSTCKEVDSARAPEFHKANTGSQIKSITLPILSIPAHMNDLLRLLTY